MSKAKKPRDANKPCVKDNLKDSEDITKNKCVCDRQTNRCAVIGTQNDYSSFSQRCYSSRILDWYKPSSFEFSCVLLKAICPKLLVSVLKQCT